MRLLVLSDSHRHISRLVEAIEKEPSAEVVYFLGDGYNDIYDVCSIYSGKKTFIILKGNCDFSPDIPLSDVRSIENVKIYASHGAEENVKLSFVGIKRAALESSCNLALFGHTHEKYYSYENGLHLFNPGSIKEGSYGVIDITEKGIMCIHKKLY